MLNVPTTFKFRCPHCNKKHAVPESYIGRVVMCQPCGNSIHVVADAPPPRQVDTPSTSAESPEEAIERQIAAGWGTIFQTEE